MNAAPTLELAEIVRQHGDAFLAQYGSTLTQEQRRALRAVERCRTAALGGQWWQCADCGQRQVVYHSCRNRHCPKCQASARARWLEQQQQHLLPVDYFHVVFTLPAPLAPVALANPTTVYGLLFQAASQTLLQVAADPKHLGAVPGLLLVLHTWGQTLQHHPHVHGVVTGGGLSCDSRGRVEASPRWVSCRPGFFLPVRVLSRVYRGKFLALLRQAYAAGQLRWDAWPDARAFQSWLTPLYESEWVVYAKPPFGGPQQVLKYLARYTHRVAISNQRLVQLAAGQVTFRYQDRRQQRPRQMTVAALEFLRRWVVHVLPRGFVKVRHYGVLANRGREQRLSLCRWLLWLLGLVLGLGGSGAAPAAEVRPGPTCGCCGSARLVRVGEAAPVLPVLVCGVTARDTS